uniref:Uncharacterized protein n=1 Tax=Megaviridae environmental sample TaxID=1737588 RepID=A0A5J6VIN9_9VIRU|nr:MAG: hypothetical protein [Megaviridae environmental sample]
MSSPIISFYSNDSSSESSFDIFSESNKEDDFMHDTEMFNYIESCDVDDDNNNDEYKQAQLDRMQAQQDRMQAQQEHESIQQEIRYFKKQQQMRKDAVRRERFMIQMHQRQAEQALEKQAREKERERQDEKYYYQLELEFCEWSGQRPALPRFAKNEVMRRQYIASKYPDPNSIDYINQQKRMQMRLESPVCILNGKPIVKRKTHQETKTMG